MLGSCTAIVDYKDYDQFPARGDGNEQSVRDLRFRMALYADKNNNLVYDLPDEDHAWRLVATGEATGLSLSFTHNTDFQDIAP